MKTAPIDATTSQEISQKLSQVLANTYVLYTKTQNFHWNLEDTRFYSLHLLFEKQYTELAEALDEIAERMRMIGEKSPGSMRQFLELTTLEESDNELSGDEMIRELMEDHTTLANTLRPIISDANKKGDDGTADMLIQLLRSHEKNAWMLRSHLT